MLRALWDWNFLESKKLENFYKEDNWEAGGQEYKENYLDSRMHAFFKPNTGISSKSILVSKKLFYCIVYLSLPFYQPILLTGITLKINIKSLEIIMNKTVQWRTDHWFSS